MAFDNLSGDPEQEYFSDGITEDIITALSKTDQLFVIARNSTFIYKGKPVKIKQVAEELGVRYVLEGSVRKSEDRVRITAQLIDATTGHHLWAERYDRDLKDIFAVQDEITMKIITALQVKLTEGEQARMWSKKYKNLDVYLKRMEGLSLWRKGTVKSHIQQGQLAQEVIDMAPEISYGYMALGWYHWYLARTGKSPRENLKKALELAQKAISLDESAAISHGLLGSIYLVMRQYEKAIAVGKRAIELDPNGAMVHGLLGLTLSYAGRPDEGIGYLNQGIRLNPFPAYWYFLHLSRCYILKGQYEDALTAIKKAIHRSPNAPINHIQLAAIYALLERHEEAGAAVKKVLEIIPSYSLESAKVQFPFKNQADLKLIVDAMRKAGFPEYPPLPIPDKPSIAVLAFDNLSGDPEQEYFSDGIAENIITALSKVGELFVIARNSSFTYKGKPVKVQQVSRELGVRYVLEGSVQKSGDRVRITAQLIDAKNGQHVWAERYDRVLKDIFAIQDDITKRVVSSLQANLTVGEISRTYARGTNSLEAYLKVMKARNIHMRFTKDDNLISRDLTQEAISIDPEYGNAYVLLAATYMLETYFGSEKSPKELMGQAIANAKKAVELETVGGHAMLGWLYSLIGQIDKALTECKIAVDLAPNSASARTWYGAVLTKAGKYDMAVQELEQALRRDPMAGTWVLRFLGSAYSLNDRHEEAISTLKKAIQKAPKDYLSRLLLTRAYVFAGRTDEAQAEAAEVLRLNPDFSLEKHAKRFKAKDTERTINALRQAGLK